MGQSKHTVNNTSNFDISIQGMDDMKFTTVSPITIDMQDVAADAGKNCIKNQPGRYRIGDITVTRPYKYDKKLIDWVKMHMEGKGEACLKNASVRLLDSDESELGRYELNGVWIKRYCGPAFSKEPHTDAAQHEEIVFSVQEAMLQ